MKKATTILFSIALLGLLVLPAAGEPAAQDPATAPVLTAESGNAGAPAVASADLECAAEQLAAEADLVGLVEAPTEQACTQPMCKANCGSCPGCFKACISLITCECECICQ